MSVVYMSCDITLTPILILTEGRAATMFAGDRYSFKPDGSMDAELIDMKGLDISLSPIP